MSNHASYAHDLASLPASALLHSVTARPGQAAGRPGLRVSLTEAIARDGAPGVDFIDQETMVVLPATITTGSIEVDLLSQLTPEAPDYARGFAGIAYRIDETPEQHAVTEQNDASTQFECVYLRPLNGTKTDPPSPRDQRGIQYFAYPDWPFDRLRNEYPDGRYEAAAPIAPGEWTNLRVELSSTKMIARVNGEQVLTVTEPKVPPRPGRVGLFVDIGTEAWFTNLRINGQ